MYVRTYVFNRDADTVGLYELVDGWGLGIKLGLETENRNRNTMHCSVCACAHVCVYACIFCGVRERIILLFACLLTTDSALGAICGIRQSGDMQHVHTHTCMSLLSLPLPAVVCHKARSQAAGS